MHQVEAQRSQAKFSEFLQSILCLSEPSQNDPVVMCNPITGEFINLPVLTQATDESYSKRFSDCGLGFSDK